MTRLTQVNSAQPCACPARTAVACSGRLRPKSRRAGDGASRGCVKRFTWESSKIGYERVIDVFRRRRVMTKLVLFFLLGTAAAPPAQAVDAKDSLRDVMDYCNQFVINDPDPYVERIVRPTYHHDCFVYDREDPWR
jgi:hypothetical protein